MALRLSLHTEGAALLALSLALEEVPVPTIIAICQPVRQPGCRVQLRLILRGVRVINNRVEGGHSPNGGTSRTYTLTVVMIVAVAVAAVVPVAVMVVVMLVIMIVVAA